VGHEWSDALEDLEHLWDAVGTPTARGHVEMPILTFSSTQGGIKWGN